jgi:hypothetical protein
MLDAFSLWRETGLDMDKGVILMNEKLEMIKSEIQNALPCCSQEKSKFKWRYSCRRKRQNRSRRCCFSFKWYRY